MPLNQNPEQLARDRIDVQLAAAGWVVQATLREWLGQPATLREQERFEKGLAWMKAKGLVPTGRGRAVMSKPA